MPKSVDYICPQCLYSTTLKSRMKKHLYDLKTPCPAKTGILLNDEIRSKVLKYHMFNEKNNISQQQTINQTINNINVLTNLVNQIELDEKICLLMQHNQSKLLDFEDELDQRFAIRVKKLENNSFSGGYYLDHDDLLKLVDTVTRVNKNELDKFNILFDKTIKRLKYYSCGNWDSFIEEMGAKEIIKLLKSYFLNTYEIYLIKNLHIEHPILNRYSVTCHLEIYYKFLASVDLDPYVIGMTDVEIIGYTLVGQQQYTISDKYTTLFQTIRSSVNYAEKTRIKKRVCSIIKENTIHNTSELNKVLIELLQEDKVFCGKMLDYTAKR